MIPLMSKINPIVGFNKRYFFLSNFFPCEVEYNGIMYNNAESAFQSQKTNDKVERYPFSNMSPRDAKKHGRKIQLRPDWEYVKENEMYRICLAKFTQNEELQHMLLATGNRYLEEANNWNDTEWGTVNGYGTNKLGKILMRIRKELRKAA